jgi:hypothetical protein
MPQFTIAGRAVVLLLVMFGALSVVYVLCFQGGLDYSDYKEGRRTTVNYNSADRLTLRGSGRTKDNKTYVHIVTPWWDTLWSDTETTAFDKDELSWRSTLQTKLKMKPGKNPVHWFRGSSEQQSAVGVSCKVDKKKYLGLSGRERVNTIRDMVVYLSALLTRADIRHWYRAGGLLSIARNNSLMLPWDDDADFAILGADVDSLLSLHEQIVADGHTLIMGDWVTSKTGPLLSQGPRLAKLFFHQFPLAPKSCIPNPFHPCWGFKAPPHVGACVALCGCCP